MGALSTRPATSVGMRTLPQGLSQRERSLL